MLARAHPVIVGQKSYNIFNTIQENLTLELVKKEPFGKKYVWILYKVENKAKLRELPCYDWTGFEAK